MMKKAAHTQFRFPRTPHASAIVGPARSENERRSKYFVRRKRPNAPVHIFLLPNLQSLEPIPLWVHCFFRVGLGLRVLMYS